MKSKRNFFYFGMIIIICAIFILGICEFYHIKRVLCELRQDINMMNIHSDLTTQTEYMQTIDFLENETEKFREFVEKQQEFLIWLIGLAGVILTGVFAFFEIKGREDISKIIREQYENQTQKEISNIIGGEEKIKYLKNCIKKEEEAKNKKILFVFHNNENINLRKVYEILEKQRYSVKEQTIGILVQDEEICRWTEENDIIVYQVGEDELENANENVAYARVSKTCNSKEVYCILYCEKHIERELYKSCFYVNNANYGLTAIERIFNLLYSI